MKWFKSLSPVWKITVIALALVVLLWVFDAFTGGLRSVKNWAFDNRQAVIEQENVELTAENAKLRAEAIAAEKAALERDAKLAVLEKDEKALDAKSKAELEKVNKALEEQEIIEAVTGQPTDPYTRCLRVKEKAIALGAPSAHNIVCEGR